MIVIGILGKSSFPDCNKMTGFQVFNYYQSLHPSDPATPSDNENQKPKDGQITFYFEKTSNLMYVHFVTPFDSYAMEQLVDEILQQPDGPQNIISFNSYARTRFAKTLLFAIQVCHIIVLVETSNSFDSSYLSIFKALKIIRYAPYCILFLRNNLYFLI